LGYGGDAAIVPPGPAATEVGRLQAMTEPAPAADPLPTWSAPVRYAEVDQQEIVFNAHYLTYCDEAMNTFCRQRGLLELAASVYVVSSTLDWFSSARWGDVVDVDARCTGVGTSSVTMAFEISVAGRRCCAVRTTYVHAVDGRPVPVPDRFRTALA
jgi:acyl-CoA thioester hydrolase